MEKESRSNHRIRLSRETLVDQSELHSVEQFLTTIPIGTIIAHSSVTRRLGTDEIRSQYRR